MFEIISKLRDGFSVIRTSYLPAAKRFWKGYGYYVSLACLLILFGTSAYIYRTNKPADAEIPMQITDISDSVMAMAAINTPEPTPLPEPEIWVPAFINPVENGICGKFTENELVWSDTLGHWAVHNGIDITASAGTAVTASESGTVSAIYEDDLYGNTIEITHSDGWVTRYCSLESIALPKAGIKVQKGDVIGSAGNSALCEIALGSHLHYEVMHNGILTEPCFD